MAHTKHSMLWIVVLHFIKLWSDLPALPPFCPTKETCPRILHVFCCYDVASLSPNKITLSKKDTVWLLPLVPTFHPTKRNLSKDLCFLLLLPTNHPTKETCQRILCSLSLLPTFHPTTKIYIKWYCVVFVAVANISPGKQKTVKEYHVVFVTVANIAPNKRPVEGYCVVFVIVSNIPPNKRNLFKGTACFLLSCLKSQKQSSRHFFLAVYTYAAICCRLQTDQLRFPSASRVFPEYGLWKVSSSRLVTMVTTDLNILSTTQGHPTRIKLCHKQIRISISSTVKSTKSIPALLQKLNI